METWVSFFFDCNDCWGLIDSHEKWREFVGHYCHSHPFASLQHAVDLRLKTACYAPNVGQLPPEYGVPMDGTPSFGFRREHTSTVTLGQWAILRGVDLNLLSEENKDV